MRSELTGPDETQDHTGARLDPAVAEQPRHRNRLRSYREGTLIPPGISRPGENLGRSHSEEFSKSLAQSSPGDIIVLDARRVYTGNFPLPEKTSQNGKWIYVISSAYNKLPAPGNRVLPADAANMSKVVTPNVATAFRYQRIRKGEAAFYAAIRL